ncbi:hypothetical protein BO86DRAFT_108939 [Aspergillus japonicus CBS 114.51]|uniref:Uncharacterized protein n=2 Tax=Aspergillus TaxID=5052 RepID=A0A2V5HCF3_ASPV1|nr:hypothetical protein BO86DRAFT_108939 [Aspergillus japonicus CBS 114.51]PYI22025.1 hypothetical protein BO99DRAFT_42446 [Aspergillus violaceofuscus CBS 115571]RAH86372.1 hypothetical protein BO86DRAFT_108939 [Aspergillus japonicus CBS 114.51]
MSTNRPFLANFLAAFRAQSTYKASTAGTQSTSASISSAQISQSAARAIATKASSNSEASSASSSTTHHYHHHSTSSSSHSRPHSHHRGPLAPGQGQEQSSPASPPPSSAATPPQAAGGASSPPPTPAASNPIPITNSHGRQRRGSDSSSGSGGFRDALGPEKWYIGGRTPGGEERFYRLGMVTKGGGRLGGSGRVGSIDQLSL